jgi:hypothetical protein
MAACNRPVIAMDQMELAASHCRGFEPDVIYLISAGRRGLTPQTASQEIAGDHRNDHERRCQDGVLEAPHRS